MAKPENCLGQSWDDEFWTSEKLSKVSLYMKLIDYFLGDSDVGERLISALQFCSEFKHQTTLGKDEQLSLVNESKKYWYNYNGNWSITLYFIFI